MRQTSKAYIIHNKMGRVLKKNWKGRDKRIIKKIKYNYILLHKGVFAVTKCLMF
jgi:hypothetical protein